MYWKVAASFCFLLALFWKQGGFVNNTRRPLLWICLAFSASYLVPWLDTWNAGPMYEWTWYLTTAIAVALIFREGWRNGRVKSLMVDLEPFLSPDGELTLRPMPAEEFPQDTLEKVRKQLPPGIRVKDHDWLTREWVDDELARRPMLTRPGGLL